MAVHLVDGSRFPTMTVSKYIGQAITLHDNSKHWAFRGRRTELASVPVDGDSPFLDTVLPEGLARLE